MDKLTLHSALYQLQKLNAAIRLTSRSVAIWSPNKRVPSLVRQSIKQHRHEIRGMILACRIEVCPSPHWHKREWYFPGPEWIVGTAVCGVCQRLAYLSDVTAKGRAG